MDIKILWGINFNEPESLIIPREKIYKEEYRKVSFFKKDFYQIYPSPDKKFLLCFKYKGDIRWGPAYYNLRLEILDDSNREIKKDFEKRIFWSNYSNSPWSFDSQKFCLQESCIPESASEEAFLSDQRLLVYNIKDRSESIFFKENRGLSFVSWSPSKNYFLLKRYLGGDYPSGKYYYESLVADVKTNKSIREF